MIAIGFVHFRTTNLAHLDAAWLTLSRQDFTDVGHVVVLDNNTDDAPADILAVLDRYPVPVPRIVCFDKHGQAARTQSWSVNRCVALCQADWIFFSRTDFLLDPDCLSTLRTQRDATGAVFLTSHCHQMGYDPQLSNTDALAAHSQPDAPWRTSPEGLQGLIGKEPAHYFHDTHIDAGVWLTEKANFDRIGGLNEKMVSWGYQQQDWQRRLAATGARIDVTPRYLFHHQHHAAPRNPARAAEEYHAARYTATDRRA